jgi:hypothetical protein
MRARMPALLLAAVALAGPAAAQEPQDTLAAPADGPAAGAAAGRLTLTTGGYLRGITVLHDRGFDLPDLSDLPGFPAVPARQTGSHGQVGRLKWAVEGAGWRLDVHQRMQVRVTSEGGQAGGLAGGASGGPAGGAAGGPGGGIGFGVGAAPDRLVDLRLELVERERVQAWHDVDRLALVAHTRGVDLTLGRQAITWGISTLFPVADLWAAFGPFEQETEEKPGIDAARALLYPAAGVELDVVVAHRGSLDALSAGARATLSRPGADLWLGGGKFWRQLMAMGGVTVLRDQSRLRAEAVLPWTLRGGEPAALPGVGPEPGAPQRPRGTLGVDRLGGTWLLGAEYHHNGIGRGDPDRYLEAAADPRFARGETYFLGRHYLGGLATWSPDVENRLHLAGTALANLSDGSAAFIPTAMYDLGQATRISAGALLSAGRRPTVTLVPPALRAGSEFGLYGHAFFTTLSVYF